MSSSKKATQPKPSAQEIQRHYNDYQTTLQALASKIGELERDAEEHDLVLTTLSEVLAEDPDRKCFRLVGGVLVERTVKDVVPALRTNRDGIKKAVTSLAEQYKEEDDKFDNFKREHNIRPASAN